MKKKIWIVYFLSVGATANDLAPEVGKHAATNIDSMSMILSLLMVLAVIIVSALVLKRFQPTIKNTQDLKVVSSVHLGTKEKLVVVQVGEQQLLLGVTANSINMLKELEKPLTVNQPVTGEIGQSLNAYLVKKMTQKSSSLNQGAVNKNDS